MQPVHARLNMESKKFLYFLLALFPVAGQIIAGLMFFSRPDKFGKTIFLTALLLSSASILAILFIAWFSMLVQNIAMQYSPSNARLIPDLPAILKRALTIPIVLMALLASGFMWLTTHHFSFFPAFISIFVLSFLVLIFRSSWGVIPFIFSFQVPAILERSGVKHVDKLFSDNLGFLSESVFFLLSIVILWLTLKWTFSMRGDALFELQARSRMLKDVVSGKKMDENKISIGFAAVFLIWMRHCVERCIQHRASRFKLAPFALGPRLHWTSSIVQMITFILFCILSLMLVSLLMSEKNKDFLMVLSVTMGGLSLVILPFIFSGVLFSTLFQTQAEQALMCLAPGSGAQDYRDKAISNYLLRQFSILYGCGICFGILMSYWIITHHESSEKFIVGIVLLLSSFFPMILGITTQYARMTSVAHHPLLKLFIVCALLFALGLLMIFNMPLNMTMIFCVLIVVVTLALFVRYRGKQLSCTIFPVGRAA